MLTPRHTNTTQVYKIDNIKRCIQAIDANTGKTSTTRTNIALAHQFDIANIDTYDDKGNVIALEKAGVYDLRFSKRLSQFEPPELVEDFLNYQYANCPNKVAFLNRISSPDILESQNLKLKPTRKEILVRWLQKKRDVLTPPELIEQFKLDANEDRTVFAERAIKWFNEHYNTMTTDTLKAEFLAQEIERTKKAVKHFLAHPDLLDGLTLEKFEGGKLYFTFLESKKAEFEGNKPKEKQGGANKLKWLGSQKQLAELIITLEENNWIEPIKDGDRKAISRTVCMLFDISDTKKSEGTDEVNSFSEILKPEYDKSRKQKLYPKVFSTRYKKCFNGIKMR